MKSPFNSLKRPFFWVSLSSFVVICLVVLTVGNRYFFKAQVIKIEGIQYVKDPDIRDKLPKDIGLFTINKIKLKEQLLLNPMLESVEFKIYLPKTLVIKVKEKDVISTIFNDSQKYYISNKYELIPWFFNDYLNKLPVIYNKENLILVKSLGIIDKLSILKKEDYDFFTKIVKIDLRHIGKTTIFMVSGREYQFFSYIELKDFLKIKVLENKISLGKKILVKGDAITIY